MNSTTTIRQIGYEDILGADNAQVLIDEYAAECSIPLIGKIDQQPEIYAALERIGALHCFGVYEDDTLVGFASVVHSILPHYGRKVASLESLFLSSDHRSSSAGRKLMAQLEKHAKEEGCVAVQYSAPVESQLALMLLASKPYECTSVVFFRSLA